MSMVLPFHQMLHHPLWNLCQIMVTGGPTRIEYNLKLPIFYSPTIKIPASKIDNLLNVWAASLAPHHDTPPFKDHKELYSTIDATPIPGGNVNWETFNLCFCPPDKDLPPDAANWKKTKWDVWYRDLCKLIDNMLQNPDFRDEFDYIPHQEYNLDGNHCFHNVMSGDWCWREAVSKINFLSLQRLTSVPECHCQRFPHSR